MLYVGRTNGLDAWDLHDYFVLDATKPYLVNGEEYCFMEKEPPYDPFLSQMTVYSCVPFGMSSPPDCTVVIGSHDYHFGLSYGWKGSTFHERCRWTVGNWRQDLTEPSWYHECDPGYERQFMSVDEIARDADRELTQLFDRVGRYERTGRYDLQWPEVAALMDSMYGQWMDATELRASFWDEKPSDGMWQTAPAGRRGGTIGFEMHDSWGWTETPLRFEMSAGISGGWQLNLFAPYSTVGECPWYEGIVFRSEHVDAQGLQLQCPLAHPTSHRMLPTVIEPWELWQYLSTELLPVIARDARHRWMSRSIGW